MIVDLAQNGFLEVSLLVRAVAYAVFFTMLGVIVIRAKYPLNRLERGLGWVAVSVGFINAIMALEWLYLFFFTAATIG